MKKLKSIRELDVIRGKMLSGAASTEETNDFLAYVKALEELVEEASDEDFYGTEGYQYRLGIDD